MGNGCRVNDIYTVPDRAYALVRCSCHCWLKIESPAELDESEKSIRGIAPASTRAIALAIATLGVTSPNVVGHKREVSRCAVKAWCSAGNKEG